MMSTATIISQLKRSGDRLTENRLKLINILAATSQPLSVLELVKKNSSQPHKTTVYRELAFLLKNNLVEEIIFNDGIKRYEISSQHHHHLVCTNCKKISKIAAKKICHHAAAQLKKTGYIINNHSMEFFGICPKCQNK
ncbi:MAG: Fur family transcriptional regulator [Patescibacteria group bacterium]|nr:Fur family transcriptional regulator [Patescibacteria group bacterium]